MTETSKTHYLIESHAYTENVPCADPETCEIPSHWQDTEKTSSIDNARQWVELNDSPAVRVTKITRIETQERIRL